MNKTTALIIAFFLALTHPVHGKKLYKYQDEQGRWHFTDKPPTTAQPTETQQLRIDKARNKVSIRNRGSRSEPLLYIVNEYRGPVEVEITLPRQTNIRTEPGLPARFTVPATGAIRAVRLTPVHKHKSWSYQYAYRVVLGDPKAQHRPPQPYLPPFQRGQTFPITQAFHGKYSHHYPQSEYAVDIAMPEGTPVHAARKGMVMDVSNDFYTGGTDKDKYLDRANSIRILHADGSMAVYAHLKLETAQVSPGMAVSRGQLIAESGSTGYSSGPHLHFVIQKNVGMQLVSVPFTFSAGPGQAITPERGMLLSTPP